MDFFENRGQPLRAPADVEVLAKAVIGAAIEVHRVLGPGPIGPHYQMALSHELRRRGVPHVREAEDDVVHKGEAVGKARVDILVAGKLIVEVKAVDALTDVHRSRALTYLRLQPLPLALLINFNVSFLRDGIRRVINT